MDGLSATTHSEQEKRTLPNQEIPTQHHLLGVVKLYVFLFICISYEEKEEEW